MNAKSERTKFCKVRNRVHEERQRQYNVDIAHKTYGTLPDSQIFVQCKNCKGGFVAKKVDRKRGWARYCSKSCKAQCY